jgi:hypothetical protein
VDPQGQPQLYEVRCYRCNCSFAPGTRQCLHCGGRLLPPGIAPAGVMGTAAPGAEQEVEAAPPSFARVLLWLVSAGLAVALSALQTCGRG